MNKQEFCAFLTNYYGEPVNKLEQQVSITFAGEELYDFCNSLLKNQWVDYDALKQETHPKGYGKYFICRKDGKIHWETWNGTTWAYNGPEIIRWMKIIEP